MTKKIFIVSLQLNAPVDYEISKHSFGHYFFIFGTTQRQ